MGDDSLMPRIDENEILAPDDGLSSLEQLRKVHQDQDEARYQQALANAQTPEQVKAVADAFAPLRRPDGSWATGLELKERANPQRRELTTLEKANLRSNLQGVADAAIRNGDDPTKAIEETLRNLGQL